MLFGMSISVQNIFDFVGANIVAVERGIDRSTRLAIRLASWAHGRHHALGKITASTLYIFNPCPLPSIGASGRLLRRLVHNRYSRVPVTVS